MDIVKLLKDAKKDGVKIDLIEGELQIEATADKKHWLGKLRPHKQEILSHLIGEPTDGEIDEPVRQVDKYRPFPTSALPAQVEGYVSAASKAIGCDPSFVALPLLASLARAIGNKRVIRLKSTWCEPAIIWAAMIGKSGTHKTPAMQIAMKFLDKLQAKSISSHAEAMQQFDIDVVEHDRDFATWKKSKGRDLPPIKPELPVCNRYVTSDSTIEALAMLLHDQFDGLLVSRDELAGWLNGIAEYKGGSGSDLGHWLAMWSAAPLVVDRKTGAIKMIHIPRAAVSLVGGIQPGTLRKAIGQEHMQDGLCARLLLAMPPSKPVTWSDATVSTTAEKTITGLFDRLIDLEPGVSEQGEAEPTALDLTPEAKTLWVKYFNRHRSELVDLDDDLAAAWSKLEAYTARFALIFQLCDCPEEHSIDETSMQAAIELSDWFGVEAKRVYGMFSDDKEGQEQRELVGLIERKGGSVTPRDLMRSCRKFKTSSEAEKVLGDLVKAGVGNWVVVSSATNKRRQFTLLTALTVTNSPNSADLADSVSVNGVSRQEWEASL